MFSSNFLFQSLSNPEFLYKKSGVFKGVSLDSRQNLKDKIFFAVKGKRFDGHDFLSQAFDKGAGAFVVSDLKKARFFLKNKKRSIILVPDTVKALTDMARSWRKLMQVQVIGITGSNGKSTTRCFTESVLSQLLPFASPKSYNNAIGVSLSILNVSKKSAFLIQEIGTGRPGEIAFLTQLSHPIVSAVTMAGPSHLEGFKSVSAIAREKQDIYLQSPQAVWVFNRDNKWTRAMWGRLSQTHPKILGFSSHEKTADVRLRFLKESQKQSQIAGHIGSLQSQSKVLFFGRENLENFMCACALGLAVGLKPEQIWKQAVQCRLPKGRQEFTTLKNKKISICFDAYNANPSSMEFFFNSSQKSSFGQNRIFILGDMKELGKESEKYHKELSHNPILLSSRVIFFVGEYACLIEEELKKNHYQGIFKAFTSYSESLSSLVKKHWKKGDFIGIKASRTLGLERLFFDLTGKKIL